MDIQLSHLLCGFILAKIQSAYLMLNFSKRIFSVFIFEKNMVFPLKGANKFYICSRTINSLKIISP